jgi:hypothetical protein
MKRLIIAVAILAALTASTAQAAPSQGWTCHKYGPGFFQWHCH